MTMTLTQIAQDTTNDDLVYAYGQYYRPHQVSFYRHGRRAGRAFEKEFLRRVREGILVGPFWFESKLDSNYLRTRSENALAKPKRVIPLP